ncbi:hypothetical protein RHMOL_Rhmol02G0152700 [Rhododendron molle]|uniref:Uncharacterized protein n=1 Tax=Rhododendron molle TaxID=49168 RepID=A0ACC0PQH6_RHOML|nr:hypothetical protein RHMOL_Rhmol02G0152700 [Rhododendron molle]
MTNNEVMEVSGESGDSPWPTRNEKIFIQLMDKEVKSKKSREIDTFTGQAWKRIVSELKRLTAYNYSKEQVKNKYFALRILFNSFNSLKGITGVGWDSTLLTITAPDDVWKRLFKVNKLVRKFKKKKEGMPYYNELCCIFGDTSATGVHAHPSNKVPSCSDSSDLEFKIVDEPEVESPGGSKTKPKAKNRKRDSVAANISNALSQFAENGKRRVDVMEKKLHGSYPGCSGVSGSMSIRGNGYWHSCYRNERVPSIA